MHGLIAFTQTLVLHHPATALVVAFAAAVLEAVVVVGALVPGTAVMMAVAGVASAAGLPKPPFLLVAAAGAVVGDTFSYWVGHAYGGHVRGVWPLSRYPGLLARAETFFRHFGAPSVVVARFIPGLRAAVPLVAGMAGMALRPFLVADVLAALVWAPLHILPAQYAGVAVHRLHEGDWQTAAGLGAALLLLAGAAWFMHRLLRRQTALAETAKLQSAKLQSAKLQSATLQSATLQSATLQSGRLQSAASRSRRDAAAG